MPIAGCEFRMPRGAERAMPDINFHFLAPRRARSLHKNIGAKACDTLPYPYPTHGVSACFVIVGRHRPSPPCRAPTSLASFGPRPQDLLANYVVAARLPRGAVQTAATAVARPARLLRSKLPLWVRMKCCIAKPRTRPVSCSTLLGSELLLWLWWRTIFTWLW